MGRGTLARHRNLRFLRDEGEGGGGGNGDPGQTGENGKTGQNGKEHNPPPKPWTPPANEEEFNRIITDRLARERAKYPQDIDTLKQKADAWDELARESQTDHEKALEQARDEALQEAMSTVVPEMVDLAFRMEAKGVLSDEQVDSLLEDLDLIKYATDEGKPDLVKIARKVQAFAPAKGEPGRNGGHGPGFGQGNGHQQSTVRKGEQGLAEARRRFPEAFASKS